MSLAPAVYNSYNKRKSCFINLLLSRTSLIENLEIRKTKGGLSEI